MNHDEEYIEELEDLNAISSPTTQQRERIEFLIEEIEKLKSKIKATPFLDDVDLRYNRWEKVPVPSTQAVMFCMMDVSASMGEWEKEMSKRFFMLLYLFLIKNYERVEIEFIRHTQTAKLVDEEEFFYSKETGGTQVSSGLELMTEVINQKYPTDQWNIFACQASDGDNWPNDSIIAQEILVQQLLPQLQYFAYVEVHKTFRGSDLWKYYEDVKAQHSNFEMTRIRDMVDIYPVFRGLFEKREK